MSKFSYIIHILLTFNMSQYSLATQVKDEIRNDRPIIGILAQEREGEEAISFVAMPYAKHMEGSGARVVPILVQQDDAYYQQIVKETNGLLFPGGHKNISGTAYYKAAERLFRYATEANDKGDYYPIYGVSQGLHIIASLILDQWNNDTTNSWLTPCSAEDISVNLHFPSSPSESRIFRDAPQSVLRTLTSENVTPNYHKKCVTPANVAASNIHRHLNIVSTSNDSNGETFVSTFESVNKSRPIYLLQWHPEMILFEFKIIKGAQETIVHTPSAILMAQYMSNFIVGESKRNANKYPTIEAENDALIFNCNPVFTMGKIQGDIFAEEHFSQVYWFSSLNGCDGSDPFLNYNIIIIGALAVLVVVTLIGVFVANWIYRRRNDEETESLVDSQ